MAIETANLAYLHFTLTKTVFLYFPSVPLPSNSISYPLFACVTLTLFLTLFNIFLFVCLSLSTLLCHTPKTVFLLCYSHPVSLSLNIFYSLSVCLLLTLNIFLSLYKKMFSTLKPKSYSFQLGLIEGQSKRSKSKSYPQVTESRLGTLEVQLILTFP